MDNIINFEEEKRKRKEPDSLEQILLDIARAVREFDDKTKKIFRED